MGGGATIVGGKVLVWGDGGQSSTTKEVIRFYWTVPTPEHRVGGVNGVSQSLEELHALSKAHTAHTHCVCIP